MRNIKIYIFTISLSVLAVGCHLFESTKVSSKEIKAASTWSEKDQSPTFSECESIDDAENKKICFESTISNSILDFIDQNPLESSESISEEISVVIIIDKEGYFSLDEIERSRKMDNAIPNLEEQLLSAINMIPQAEPAIKTNVGTFVSTKIVLPIMIVAD
tara:strand:+ start:8824 stop:9306 length:483 start_codon:yes stop_codon:yes gene_type:complete